MIFKKVSILSFALGVFFLLAQNEGSQFLIEPEREINRCEENSDIDDVREKEGLFVKYKITTDNDSPTGLIANTSILSNSFYFFFKKTYHLYYISSDIAFYLLYCCLRIPC
jgi:hypothetical protein